METRYAKRLYRADPVDAGGCFAADRPVGPAAVALGADRRRGVAGLAIPGFACNAQSRVVPVFIPAATAVLRWLAHAQARILAPARADRKSVVSGKSVSVRVDLGGRRNIKKKK